MQRLLRPFRRAGVVASVLTGVVAAVLGLAVLPAGATQVPAQNNILIGSGSATAYNLMQGMDTLFSDSPGCNIIDIGTVPQELDFGCPSQADTIPPPTMSTTFAPYPDFTASAGYTENPNNDVGVQEPPYGSSGGILQVEDQGAKTEGSGNTAPVNYARASRALKASDNTGLNDVAYAVDGVSWFHYPEVNGHPTPSANVKSLTLQLLQDAYNGTLQCWNDPVVAAESGTPTMTYSSPGCEPIILYTAQSSSGTRATWDGYLGYTQNPVTDPLCCSAAYLNSINGTSIPNVQKVGGGNHTITYNAASHTILENEDRELVANGDEANALFFFSWGKYQVTCKVGKCGVIPGATGTTTEKLGKIDVSGTSIAPTQNSILCGAGVGGTGCGPTVNFPDTRFLHNDYSTGGNSQIPEATPDTLNYVSEIGFICKPQTTDGTQNGPQILDPNSGVWYRTEIDQVIQQQGFIPMPFQSQEVGSSVTSTATSLLNAYHSANPSNALIGEYDSVDTVGQTPTSEQGYCLVTSPGTTP